ncbi:MAG: trypsin-like peptidase domain-containing protein [Chthoniobacterales bacterium]|nr:trypsin-like peptidase domain-containing protein [Chthoniobacterales bacterium]
MRSAVCVLWSILALAVPARAQDEAAKASVRAMGNAFGSVYEKVAPSVVVLEVNTREDAGSATDAMIWDLLFQGQQEPDPPPRLQESEGSGFIIREDGYILTNAHVVDGADPERGVVARLQDGTRLPLTIVGIDDKTDLAVLKAKGGGLPAIEWGDSDKARIGEFVCGIGAPFELDYTLTVGVLSAKGRSNLSETLYEDYLQTDAAINPGNSGGPLCDLDGRVIGVNTLINGLSRGLSFAIPARLAREISDELIAKGRVVRPWLGVRITTLGEEPALQQMMGIDKGVLVKTIEPDAPASRSELRPADVIVSVDGEEVLTARDLQKVILRKKVGEEVDLKVWRRAARDGTYRKIAVTTGELPAAPFERGPEAEPSPPAPDDGSGRSRAALWGLALEKVGPDSPGGDVPSSGVRVTAVDPGSPGAVAGVEPGDVITGIGPDAVSDEASFLKAMEKTGRDEAAVLMVERDGKKTYAILKR